MYLLQIFSTFTSQYAFKTLPECYNTKEVLKE